MEDNPIFVDTNILISAVDPDRKNHGAALHLIERINRSEFTLLTSGQVLREFRVVTTRPVAVNGLGLPPDDVSKMSASFATRGLLLEEDREVFEIQQQLCRIHKLVGKPVHDANIAATVLRHGYTKIYTNNRKDFARYKDLEIIEI